MEPDLKKKDLGLEDNKEIVKMQTQLLETKEEINLGEETLVKVKVLEIIKMPRPCRRRRVRGRPNSSYFKPSGIEMFKLQEIVLTLPEFEAIRLIDFQEIEQNQAAKQMEISQPTLSRLLKSARKKISDAIINGKAIKIENKSETN